ncbi:hypothetical protein SLEP1_g45212 [Rubroshorea leprosula]|uniref:SHSP domain-containing protein n=1 Tax=Rubroshorea leprosula TaxID=152421 RepID=A0AAV5LK07_9ROSI|nr:hypothetical protein SLEP1_g45212 [Rubroshorea leprosula]
MALVSQFSDDEIYEPFLSMINKCPVLNTPTDWNETPDAHVFIADLPGLKKEEVKVEVDDGRFLRRFRLPENAKTDEIKAPMENGVLKVTIPKQEVRKPEKKVIQIEGN